MGTSDAWRVHPLLIQKPNRKLLGKIETGRAVIQMKRIHNAEKVEIIRKAGSVSVSSKKESNPAERRPDDFYEGQKVSLVIGEETALGFKAVINSEAEGVLYKSEVFQPLQEGQKIDGFIKKIREDKKIDLSLYKQGYKKIDSLADRILEKLKSEGGFIPVTDKSAPETISELFGISKKAYKMIAGRLYKDRLISIEDEGIRLIVQRPKAQGTGRMEARKKIKS
jgi:predicted RNA-binding protein (virulence factor B family)